MDFSHEVKDKYERSRMTINYRKITALKQIRKKWKDRSMRNKELIPFEIIERQLDENRKQ